MVPSVLPYDRDRKTSSDVPLVAFPRNRLPACGSRFAECHSALGPPCRIL